MNFVKTTTLEKECVGVLGCNATLDRGVIMVHFCLGRAEASTMQKQQEQQQQRNKKRRYAKKKISLAVSKKKKKKRTCGSEVEAVIAFQILARYAKLQLLTQM